MSEQGSPQEALAALKAHVQGARQAAESLAHEAGSRGSTQTAPTGDSGTGGTPRRGWAPHETAVDEGGSELRALAELVGSLRSLLPDELREPVNELLRQLLALLRAVIDWLALRMQPPQHGAQPQVQDIPIT